MSRNFHPKARTWALRTYDYLRELRDESERSLEALLSASMGFYEEIHNSNPKASKSKLDRFKGLVNEQREVDPVPLDNVAKRFSEDSATSPLKSINAIFLRTLETGTYCSDALVNAFKKMTFSKKLKRSLRVKLIVSDEVLKDFEVEGVLLSTEEIEEVRRLYKRWLTQLYHEGLDKIQADPFWQDHEIGVYSDRWTGRRSVKLNRKKARLIYRVEEEVKEQFIVATIVVERITGLHNYNP